MRQSILGATGAALLALALTAGPTLAIDNRGDALEATASRTGQPEAGADSWRDLWLDSEGFSVAMPGRPEFLSKSTRTIIGVVSEKAYRAPFGGGFFSVHLHELPGISHLLAPTRIVLERARDAILEDHDGVSLSFKRVEAHGHPGGILTFRSAKSDFDFEEVHLILVGKRLFQLTAGLTKGSQDRSAMDRFFNSFRVLK